MSNSWESMMRTWEIHATLDSYKRRLDRAVRHARLGHETCGNMYVAMSGGKDGVALACVVSDAGLGDRMLAHAHNELNTPGMLETAEATADLLDMDLDVFEPEQNVFKWLAAYPHDASIVEYEHHKEFAKLFASGNMLVAYQYDNGFDGAFTGMRSEESRGRRMNRIMRGHMYQLSKDASWMCQPIVDWSARDVFACLVSHGAPIHPHYKLALENFGIDPESPASRVDCMIPDEGVSQMPTMMPLRELYPELWRRVVAVRPELERYT